MRLKNRVAKMGKRKDLWRIMSVNAEEDAIRKRGW